MNAAKRWKSLWAGAVLLGAVIYGCHGTTTGWETITTTFLKNDKPYGGGVFRIRDNQIISLKLADPQITFKPASQAKNPDVAEPTEEWMNDTAELLNRGTVSFLLLRPGLFEKCRSALFEMRRSGLSRAAMEMHMMQQSAGRSSM